MPDFTARGAAQISAGVALIRPAMRAVQAVMQGAAVHMAKEGRSGSKPNRSSLWIVRAMDSAPKPPDSDLIRRVAEGDRAAFALLFAAYAPRVKSYLLRLGAQASLAEDMAQEAMLSLWRRAASYDPKKAAASTWIFVIARNCWIDKLRREKVELAYRSTLFEDDEAEGAPDSELEKDEDGGRVRAAMEALSDDQRAVVRLSFFEDRPHSEIASVLALPLGTVKSRLRLAMAKLRAHLERF